MNNKILAASQCAKLFWIESHRLSEQEQYRYHLYGIYHYSSQLSLSKLKHSLQLTVDANYNLRSNFIYQDDELKHMIHHHVPVNVLELEAQTEEETKKYLLEQTTKPFNLSDEPLFRFVIIVNQYNHTYSLLLNFHHIILDGTQYDAIINQIDYFYSNTHRTHDHEEINHLKKYLDWELENQKLIDISYIQNKLEYSELNTTLPYDKQQNQTKTAFILDNAIYQKLKNYSLNKRHSIFNILKTVFAVILSKYARQDEIVLSYPINLRKNDFKSVKGCLVNTLYECYRIKETTLDATLQESAQYIQQSIKNKTYLLSPIKLREKIELSAVNCSISSIQTRLEGPYLDSMIGSEDAIYPQGNADLVLYFDDNNKDLFIQLRISKCLLNKHLIDDFNSHFSTCLENLLDNSDTLELARVSLLSKDKTEYVIRNLNQIDKEYPKTTLHQLFEEQVTKTPHEIALVFENKSLTYQQLNQKSNQLARTIRQQYSIEADTLIPILIDRSLDMVIGILGILKAGAAYVPIDPKSPQKKIQHILSDINPSVILSNIEFGNKLKSLTEAPVIHLDQNLYNDQSIANLIPINISTDLAYVIYTSGTTGNSKGVMVEHRSALNTIFGILNQCPLIPGYKKYCSNTPLFFDPSVLEIFVSLLNACELHIISDKVKYSPELFSQYVNDHALNYIHIPPALLSLFPKTEHPSIQWIMVGGEPCESKTVQYWAAKYTLYNVYGPTETSIISTCAKMTGEKSNVIGKPLANQYAYVLDNNLNPVPSGVCGELYIGGEGVTRGYLNQAKLTQERYIQNPFVNNSRMYRTGDVVRMDDNGNIEYIGRNDNQVKIRGFRIELLEIEKALSTITELKKSCVLVKEINGEKAIVCYYLTNREDLFVENIIKELKNSLMDYMIPSYWQKIEALPLTANGKIDYKKLTALAVDKSSIPCKKSRATMVGDMTQTQSDILSAWKELLLRDDIGLDANFFDVGGHSLKIIQLKAKLEKCLSGATITAFDLFKYPTIRSFSEYLLKDKIPILKINSSINSTHADNEIAIIGISGAFSGSSNIDEYWENIKKGNECIEFLTLEQCKDLGVPQQLYMKANFIPAAGRIKDIDEFDFSFWGMSPKESALLDPLIRKFLEHSWNVLEQTGYIKSRKENNIGVFCGASSSAYMDLHVLNNPANTDINVWEVTSMHANTYLAVRLSYMLGLTGPAININTACSTSLVSIIEACEKLVSGKCDMALAGAVNFMLPEQHGYLYEEGMIYSKDGHCRPFDKDASGTINGSGIGVLLLKRLKDATKDNDNIIAIVKGYATNNDGQRKIGFSAPSPIGQAECILAAQHQAGVTADTIRYVECHGTGTRMGDPIEIAALSDAFNSNLPENKSIDCILGSVKAVIGHTDTAAGVAGVIKVCKMLEDKVIPPQINFKSLNPEIKIKDEQFKIINEAIEWKTKNYPRRAAVSSFGIGGTNAHIIIEEYIKS